MTTMRELERWQRRQRRLRIAQAVATWLFLGIMLIMWMVGAVVIASWVLAWLLR